MYMICSTNGYDGEERFFITYEFRSRCSMFLDLYNMCPWFTNVWDVKLHCSFTHSDTTERDASKIIYQSEYEEDIVNWFKENFPEGFV